MTTPTPPPPPPPLLEALVQQPEPAARAETVRNLELKALALLAFTVCLVIGAALYLLKARGYFEPKQQLVLITENAEGVAAGQDLTFAGFPIGTVQKVALGPQGNVLITIDVNSKDAHWLRTSSVFTLIKGLVGGAQLRAYSGVMTDPPLPPGAERNVLRGDAAEELQRVISTARDVLENMRTLTASDSEINRTVANLQAFTQKLQGNRGALHALLGNDQDAQKLVLTIDRANAVLARVDQLVGSADRMVNNADRQVFGPNGLSTDVAATIRQAQALLGDVRASLQKVDAVLVEAQGVGANVRSATADLGSLRGDVEASLRKVEDMINEINRKWPFATQREVQLP